ncbi:Forkhead box protein L1 [Coemansia biformis]|uniref:Forkhead box protein L1 n=1 Tax=Coemansia biformis TaxID=1286918 RepID=A0A9W8D0U1_9FUNG|nr:Forkhead box protein L1 [Coemansia biformis]
MNSEYTTPARSQQHSPAPLTSQPMAGADAHFVAPTAYGLAPLDMPAPTIDITNAHLAYLKTAYPHRPFSPSSVDFAGMNIASGYHTPHSATPTAMQPLPFSTQPDAAAAPPPAPALAAQPPSPEKPDFSYASLIAQSLVDAPVQRRTLNGIYEWIQERFPYYRTRQNWQNSIRHNLSLNKGFMKIKRDEAHPGKGSFWTFTPGYESCLNEGHFKPIRSRSGRAALAVAAAMAASKAASAGGPAANGASDSEPRLPATPAAADKKPARKTEKRTVRAIRSAKSLKRSHSVPPRDNSAPPPQSAATADGAPAASAAMPDAPIPMSLAYSETAPAGVLPGRNGCKKMRVSSSQSHASITSGPSLALSCAPMMSYPQTPTFVPSPALMDTTPMSVVTTAMHTPLNQSATFHFHMPSPCSMPLPLSAMDMTSVPTATAAGGPYGIGGAFVAPPALHLGDSVSSGVDGATLYSDAASTAGDPLCATRRAHMQPRISWHGTESMHQAFASIQQQHQQRVLPNSLGVSMAGESVDMGLAVLGAAGAGMCVSADHTVGAMPVDWAMLANMPAPSALPVDMSVHTPHLHHMSSMSSIDAHNGLQDPQRAGIVAGAMQPTEPAVSGAGSASNHPGFMAFYDEMLRDPSSLMSVFGQDLSGWQCPTKTNTIDPAALCAVDPESNAL